MTDKELARARTRAAALVPRSRARARDPNWVAGIVNAMEQGAWAYAIELLATQIADATTMDNACNELCLAVQQFGCEDCP